MTIFKWVSFDFIFFTFSLLVKLLLLHIMLFQQMNLVQVFLMELGPILVLFSCIEVIFHKKKMALYIVVDVLLTTFLIAQMLYFKQFGIIFSYHAIKQVGLLAGVKSSISHLFRYVLLLMYVDIQIFAIIKFLKMKQKPSKNLLPGRYYLLTLIAGIALSFGTIYQQADTAINTTMLAKNVGILNAQVFELHQSTVAGNTYLDNMVVSQEKIRRLKNLPNNSEVKYFGAAEGKNIIIIQVESLQNFPLDLEISGQEVTPNLNKLMRQGFYFPRFFSQIAQGNTSDAEFITNTSLYPPAKGAVASTYVDKDFPSLPKMLRNYGYRSVAFHANDIAFWNRDKLYPQLGFDKFYDRSFFGEQDIIDMGPSDEILFSKSYQILLDMYERQQKFYAYMVTLTGHYPFVLPNGRSKLDLPRQLQNTLTGNYLRAVNYEDVVLGQFISTLKQDGLWRDLVLVIVGDHFGLSATAVDKKEKEALSVLTGKTYDNVEAFNVPLIIVLPNVEGQKIKTAGGQVDILPTLANLLGISLNKQIHFGVDLLNSPTNLVPIRYYLPEGSYFDNEYLYVSDINSAKRIETGKVYSGQRDELDAVKNLIQMSDTYLESIPKFRD